MAFDVLIQARVPRALICAAQTRSGASVSRTVREALTAFAHHDDLARYRVAENPLRVVRVASAPIPPGAMGQVDRAKVAVSSAPSSVSTETAREVDDLIASILRP